MFVFLKKAISILTILVIFAQITIIVLLSTYFEMYAMFVFNGRKPLLLQPLLYLSLFIGIAFTIVISYSINYLLKLKIMEEEIMEVEDSINLLEKK